MEAMAAEVMAARAAAGASKVAMAAAVDTVRGGVA